MKGKDPNPAKELYKQLRQLTCEQLWTEAVPQFNQSTGQERIETVGVIRAVGVVFSESGNKAQKEQARKWLQSLLQDPIEKVRRYAMVALPKIGAGQNEEVELIGLLKKSTSDREKKFLSQTLEKIGGEATLGIQAASAPVEFQQTVQRVRARQARELTPSTVRYDKVLADITGLRIHLRCRAGLELLVQDEIEAMNKKSRPLFHIVRNGNGMIVLAPLVPFKLGDIFTLRCFGTASIQLGTVKVTDTADAAIGPLADIIGGPAALRIFETLTEGPTRYRLDFAGKGHQRSFIKNLAQSVYNRSPALLNDSREAPWTITIFQGAKEYSVELSPRMSPDPRFNYRVGYVPAASHPPLAACMVRMAGKFLDEVVWDPFCGSGLELIECAMQGSIQFLQGTDRSADAIRVAQENFTSAIKKPVKFAFTSGDFRDFAKAEVLPPGTVSLIITNPPMGRRVPIGNLTQLIEDLFKVAGKSLRPGGRLIIANPLRVEPADPSLKLQYRQIVDMGGFKASLEKYVKAGSALKVEGRAPKAEGRRQQAESSKPKAEGRAPIPRTPSIKSIRSIRS
ncbi:MAG: methyltransferase [Verrucomicrobiota bacterium]|nr:methyltransferase [Verrucomicrobiota bacterium]